MQPQKSLFPRLFRSVIVRDDLITDAAPAWAKKILYRWGLNTFGEPQLRLIFIPFRTILYGGYWGENGEWCYRRVPKYGYDQKWAVERWLPAANYGHPDLWHSQTMDPLGYETIGPYPIHGEYELTDIIFSTHHGPSGYVPLLPDALLRSCQNLWANRGRPVWDIKYALLQEEKDKDKLADKHFEEYWHDQMGPNRLGLTTGAGGVINKAAKRAEHVRTLISKNLGIDAKEFKQGFSQYGN